MSIWNDTLRPRGRYELKRCMAVAGFNTVLIYIFMPAYYEGFEVHEFVVFSLLGFSAGCLGIAVHEKIKTPIERTTSGEDVIG